MGIRDRLKKRVKGMLGGRENPAERKAPPPPRKVRAKAVYRTGSDRPIEGGLDEPLDTAPEPEPEAAPIVSDVVIDKLAINPDVVFQIHLVNEDEGLDTVLEVFENEFILDAADRQAVDLPSSCRNGGCTVCAGKLLQGELRMSEDQYVLEDEEIEEGFYLLCCTTATRDGTILTHQDEAVE